MNVFGQFLTTLPIKLHFRVEIKMARRITQETFDAVVKENIEEFEMDAEEALREAVQQFESQGNIMCTSIMLLSPK